jgi:hypothetical protein
VTAISRPDGTAARKIQRARSSQVGAGASLSSVSRSAAASAGERSSSAPHQDDQQAVAAGPDQVLRAQREHRLQQHRIGQQREEAADVGRGVEEIRIGAGGMAGAHEPGLQQRVVGGEREERQADRDQEQAEQPERVARGRRIAPGGSDRERQGQPRHDQQHQMRHDGNGAVFDLHQEVSVGVTGEQQRLEKHHRHRPHRGRAAESWQHHLGEQRLHREQQQRTDEDRGSVDHQHQPVPRIGKLLRRSRLVEGGGGRTHGHSGMAPAAAGRRARKHMTTARAMRGGFTIASVRAVLSCMSSLCNLVVISELNLG